ncbi:MAG: HAMP domain-containing histidine kinase [Bacteroidetes bacterium]|nr:HAMP domain-containing histidine kinase [Bacteroidota bacterium]
MLSLRVQIIAAGIILVLSSTLIFWFLIRPAISESVISERMTVISQLHRNFVARCDAWFLNSQVVTDALLPLLGDGQVAYEQAFGLSASIHPDLAGQDVYPDESDDVLSVRNNRYSDVNPDPINLTYLPVPGREDQALSVVHQGNSRILVIRTIGSMDRVGITVYTYFDMNSMIRVLAGYRLGTEAGMVLSGSKEVIFRAGELPDSLVLAGATYQLDEIAPVSIGQDVYYLVNGSLSSAPYRLTLMIPQTVLTGPVETLFRWIVVILVVMIGLSVVAVLIFSNTITRPVHQLVRSLTPIRSFDFSKPVHPVRLPDLRPISESLESMRVALYEYDLLKTRQLILAESRNQFMINYIDDLLVFGDEEGRFRFMNNRMKEWLAGNPETGSIGDIPGLVSILTGSAAGEPLTVAHSDEAFRITIEKSESNLVFPGKPDKEVFSWQFITIAEREGQTPLGYLLLLHDMTLDRQVEEVKRDMMSIMVHELRNPITSIMGFTQLMMDDKSLSTENKAWLDIMLTASQKLASLINRFLDVQRLESGRMEVDLVDADLVYVWSETIRSFTPQLQEKQLTVTFQPPAGLSKARADYVLMGEVVQNLLSNAIKYGDPGRNILVSMGESADQILMSVTDFGYGISPADQQKLFTKFYRVRSHPKAAQQVGTGLGLAYVKEIISRHHGSITLESTPEIGCRFTIRIPKAKPGGAT